MRAMLLMLTISVLAHAQFDSIDERAALCQESCCSDAGGRWDSDAGECLIQRNSNQYYSCSNTCLDEAGQEIDRMGIQKGICCAPAMILLSALSIAAFAARRQMKN